MSAEPRAESELLATVRKLIAIVEAEEWGTGREKPGNLGHCHRKPPFWDSRALGICERCETYMKLRELATEPVEPGLPPSVPQ